MFRKIIDTVRNEPTRITGVVTAACTVGVDYGLLNTTQEGHVLGLASALLVLIGAEVTRAKVSPARKPPAVGSTPHPMSTGVAPDSTPTGDDPDDVENPDLRPVEETN